MTKKKVMAFVLAASTTGGIVIANNKIANADEINNKVIQFNKSIKTGTVVNVTSSLRVREGSSTNTRVLGYLHEGQTVKIKGKKGVWYEIEFNNSKGYVHSDYIRENDNFNNNDSLDSSSKEKGKVINVTSTLRIRSDASIDSSIIGHLNPGQTIDIEGRSGSWFKIKYNGMTGYVNKDYVEVLQNNHNGNEESDVETLVGKGKVINVETNLRIRSSANTHSKVLGYLLNGESFDIVAKKGKWYKIKKNGIEGYISSDYVKLINEVNSGENNSDKDNVDENHNIKGNTGEVINIQSNLRVRNAPNTNSSVIGYLLNGDKIEIISKSGEWYKIKKGDIIGFVDGDYIKVTGNEGITNDENNKPNHSSDSHFTNQYGIVVNVNSSLRFREGPSTSSSVIGYLLPGEQIKVLERDGDWYKINTKGKNGYAHRDYVKLVEGNSSEVSSPTYENVYNILSAQIGTPYVWGGKGELLTTSSLNRLKSIYPDVAAEGRYNIPSKYINNGYRAFDCSGLLYWGFNHIGINIGASTYDQINAGREVSLDDIRPGDLLFYSNLHHVGMYVGNGKWIEAPRSGEFVKIADVPFNKVGRARRVIE